jgi:hypothetical protein
MSVIASFSATTNYPSATYDPVDGLALDAINHFSGQNYFEGPCQLEDFDITAVDPTSAVTVGALGDELATAALLFNDNLYAGAITFDEVTVANPVDDTDAANLLYLNDQIKGKDAATLGGTQTFTGDNNFQYGLYGTLRATTITAPISQCDTATLTNFQGSGTFAPLLTSNVAVNGELLYGWPMGLGYWQKTAGAAQNYIGNTSGAADSQISLNYTFFFTGNATTNSYLTLPSLAHVGQKINIIGLGNGPLGLNFGPGGAVFMTGNTNVVAPTVSPYTQLGNCKMCCFLGIQTTILGNLPVWSQFSGD